MVKDPVHTNPSKQIYRFKYVRIRVDEVLVNRDAETAYCTISASQWYIMTAKRNVLRILPTNLRTLEDVSSTHTCKTKYQ